MHLRICRICATKSSSNRTESTCHMSEAYVGQHEKKTPSGSPDRTNSKTCTSTSNNAPARNSVDSENKIVSYCTFRLLNSSRNHFHKFFTKPFKKHKKKYNQMSDPYFVAPALQGPEHLRAQLCLPHGGRFIEAWLRSSGSLGFRVQG